MVALTRARAAGLAFLGVSALASLSVSEGDCLCDGGACAGSAEDLAVIFANNVAATDLFCTAVNTDTTLPTTIQFMTSLTQLVLINMALTGTLPTSQLALLTSLTGLAISTNPLLGGPVPTFPTLTLLESLELGSNSLTGTIPDAVTDKAALYHFSVRGNEVTGGISDALIDNFADCTGSNCAAQMSLLLDGNRMSGTLPTRVGTLTGLERLYVENNFFTGQIPAQIINLVNLNEFFVAPNSFTGVVPPLPAATTFKDVTVGETLTVRPTTAPTRSPTNPTGFPTRAPSTSPTNPTSFPTTSPFPDLTPAPDSGDPNDNGGATSTPAAVALVSALACIAALLL